jgi:two-component system phosphate regulon sensor histidine kinase PhoR
MVIKRSIFRRLFAGYAAFSLILIAAVFILLFFFVRDYSRRLLGGECLKSAALLADTLAQSLPDARPALQEYARALSARTQWRITIIDGAGVVLAETEARPEQMANHATRPEFASALRGQAVYDIRYSQTTGTDRLYAAAPVWQRGRILGAVRISMSLRDIALLYRPLLATALCFALLFFNFLALLVFFASLKIARSLDSLEQAARKVSAGDLQTRVYLAEENEFKPLADSFNRMTEQLELSLGQTRRQKAELETILASMQHGLLVVDSAGRIKLSNAQLREITGEPELNGRYYWEIFREADLGALLQRAGQTGQSADTELRRNARYYAVTVAPLPGAPDALNSAPQERDLVVLLRDVTEARKLEQIKKDFVTNASHELRTPLTAIRGFAETLAAEAAPEQKRYVEIIKKNTERMSNIVRDILILAELEEQNYLEKEPVELRALLQDLPPIFAARLQAKGLTFALRADTPVKIQGDAFKLQQVFINLLDNAVKYTEQGGITVTLTGERRQAVVCVEDTGIGIPDAEQSRIFERFYTADKSRSRQSGGTGLGLSIVKHIVLLHGGTVQVQSAAGQGSKFTVILPK